MKKTRVLYVNNYVVIIIHSRNTKVVCLNWLAWKNWQSNLVLISNLSSSVFLETYANYQEALKRGAAGAEITGNAAASASAADETATELESFENKQKREQTIVLPAFARARGAGSSASSCAAVPP